MELIVHRGTKKVGGTCIEVRAEKSRIILDVGLPIFDDDHQPLNSFPLRQMSKDELQAEGILPDVPGLIGEGSRPNGILLSHAHLDHTGLLDHSQPNIPVYASRGTSKMMLAGSIFSGQTRLPQDQFREINSEESVRIGDFTVTGYAVDHSTLGCLAYLIEADQKSLLYSGDLRLHGRKPELVRRLVDVMSKRRVDVLVMEGTHFGLPDENEVTEHELEERILQCVSNAPGLIVASFSPQHVDRLVSFIRAARMTNRVFVADVYTAFVLHLIRSEIDYSFDEDDELTKVYFPKTFAKPADHRGLRELADRFEKSQIEMEEIATAPSKHLMVFRPSMLQHDFQGKIPNGTTCLYSMWSGYLENADWKETRHLIEQASGKLVEVHTSGHILSRHIPGFVRSIAPKTVIPVHTFEPTRFSHFCKNVRLLNDGQTWTVK